MINYDQLHESTGTKQLSSCFRCV